MRSALCRRALPRHAFGDDTIKKLGINLDEVKKTPAEQFCTLGAAIAPIFAKRP